MNTSSSSPSSIASPPFPFPLFLTMGCCISKCRPHPHPHPHPLPLPDFNPVQHKLVIPISNTTSSSPPSPTSSASSFSCPAFSNTTISSSSSLSTSSSSSAFTSSKDRSFSNDFLWSCYKDNPHIVRINSLKQASLSLVPTKAPIHKNNPSTAISVKLKRVRSSSPANLARQKSLRKEPERPNSPCNVRNRTMRSPSPSRRFDGGSRRMTSPRANREAHSQSVSSLIRRENMRAASPNQYLQGVRRRENRARCFKIEETVLKEVESKHETEDIHNPHISLDCFIFL